MIIPGAQGGLERVANKGVAGGYAGLDSGGKLPDSQLPGGTIISSSGPVSVTPALNWTTFVAEDDVQYNLPTGDLSAHVAAGAVPLHYSFVNLGGGSKVLTINPGAGNFIANGAAAATLANTSDGASIPSVTLQLVSSSGSVNKWAVMGACMTWTPSA